MGQNPQMSRLNPWKIRVDLLSARALLWLGTASGRGEIRPEIHAYFYDRYSRLALVYETKGNTSRAKRLMAKAAHHWQLSGGDGPPFAAAMAMPTPRPPFRTWAVSGRDEPDDAA